MLSDAQLRALKPKAKMFRKADSGGLMIQVQPNGSRLWRIAYRLDGKQKMLSGGKYPTIGLGAARDWRDEVKAILARGDDPSEVFKAQREGSPTPELASFQDVALNWCDTRELVLNAKYQRRVEAHFRNDVFPVIGAKAIDEITSNDILAMLRKIEARGAIETSHRIRTYCHHVFVFARAEGHTQNDPTLGIEAAQKKKPPVVHRAKVKESDMGTFLARLENDEASEITKGAVRLTILTWARTGEIRFASKPEFENLDGAEPLWRIPGERMKMDMEHIVPLSRQAVALIKQLGELNPRSHWLFPVRESKSGVISENRMLDAMYRMGLRGKATIHGFRGTASTWANESLKYHPDVIELALSHSIPGNVRAAYNSAKYMAPRRELLQSWADWLDIQRMAAEVLG